MPHATKPILCYVTDRQGLPPAAEGNLLPTVRRAVAAGVDWIQIREKGLSAGVLLELTRGALSSAKSALQRSTRILVNDRLDVALAAAADGVHLGGAGLPVAEVTRWCRAGHAPTGFVIGVSGHSLAECLEAEAGGADYVFFGPVFATPSKAAFGPPQGVAKLAEVCRRVRIPVLAIGGLTVENTTECLAAGAAGIAAIRLFQHTADLASVVARLKPSAGA